MPRDVSSKIFVGLFALTIIMIVGHRLGWMTSALDGVSAALSYKANGIHNAQVIRVDENAPIEVHCHFFDSTKRTKYCGLAFILSYDNTKGINLTKFNRVDLDLKFDRPKGHDRLRFYLKNYNDKYSSEDDSSSLKYNSVEFTPNRGFERLSIPLDYFQVATWWISKRSVLLDDAQFDVRNVPVYEFSTGSIEVPGDYSISVKEITFYGEWVSELSLLKGLFLAWIIAAVFLLNNHRRSLEKSSMEDPLTGIYNRRGLNRWLVDEFVCHDTSIVIFYIDIDNFKRVNDSYGHVVGDALIQSLCQNINLAIEHIGFELSSSKLKHNFTRLSGDEFVVIFKGMNSSVVEQFAKRLLQYISDPLEVGGRRIKINASIGIAYNDKRCPSPEVLIGNADAAMYQSKKLGKNQFHIFDQSLSNQVRMHKHISDGLRTAIDKNLFRLVFMPIYEGKSIHIVGVEVLLRCDAEDLRGIGPEVYIPIAEEFGLINEIDLWVIEQSFLMISSVPNDERISYSINISSMELHNKLFIGHVQSLLKKYNIQSQNILFEITETSLIDADTQSVQFLQRLRAIGIRLALDDFGTGYTAFTQLLEYPVQYLKIDRSFIDQIDVVNASGTSMVDAIVSIARSYDLEVVAEGVESKAQIDYMNALDCEYLQGYYLSEPISWQELILLLSNKPVLDVLD